MFYKETTPMDLLSDEIINWHKSTFINTTVVEQLYKMEEELTEFFNALNQKASNSEVESELADVIICALVLADRYGMLIGASLFDWVLQYAPDEEKIEKIVRAKLEINKKRKWVEVSKGVYHHDERKKVN